MYDDTIKMLIMVLSPIFSMAVAWGAIRADIRNMHEKFGGFKEDLNRVEKTAEKAHERMDAHVTVYHRGAQ